MIEGSATVMIEIDASDYFADESVNWRFCRDHATFHHADDSVCEFILHIGTEWREQDSLYQCRCAAMLEAGCTTDFIEAYQNAAHAGACRVLFYT